MIDMTRKKDETKDKEKMKKHMTMPMACHEGRCRYKHRQAVDECLDCNLAEQIEHDLLKENIDGQ